MSEKFISIAIDGPVAAGKTTQAKLLAKELGFLYVDTGAMYRTIAVFMTWFPTLAPSMEKVLAGINMKLKRGQDGEQRMFLGTEDVTDQLRTPKISKLASNISALPCVRDFLLGMQRKAAEENDVVMEGRDIGTVILPDATVKIFLTADADMRAFRRWRELKQKGQTENFYNVMEDLKARDYNDSHREVAPLKQAEDAILLDCTELSSRETTQALLEIVRKITDI
ncbi:(d)CMP kinase [Flavonifractor plautii]|jgi:cytidylate kinase|uniref:Cytidylate kinase n=1 Tax=Flavonifractor plautii TaxID=292800 RepID=A0A6I2R637_FLAPL|nr:(d)CMP kinase [Flavonifractor plautii]MDB7956797.1 (d)CMP kinase [Flavonifractor plautii]MSB21795.1 (d)CMP kinase [Flavonifractor plautii]MSB85849.1 (d)CMP kinase [Flavonifractor plautii]GBF71310.1 cytidylate kinase [Lawsonibacter asaccharolyticus]